MTLVLFSYPVIGGELTPEQLEFYQENGYLIIKGLFSGDELAGIINQAGLAVEYAQQLARQYPQEPEQQQEQPSKDIKVMDNGTQFVFDSKTKAIKRVVWVGASYPPLLAVGRDSRLTEPVGQLLSAGSVDHLINQLHPKLPGDGVEFVYHRDIENRRSFDPDWDGESMTNGGFVQTLLALDFMNEGNGGIEVYPGSHNSSEPLKPVKDQTKCGEKLKREDKPSIFPVLQPGDVMFFHPNVAHRSLPNRSARSRWVLINGYSTPGANHKAYPGAGSGEQIPSGTGPSQAVSLQRLIAARTVLYALLSIVCYYPFKWCHKSP